MSDPFDRADPAETLLLALQQCAEAPNRDSGRALQRTVPPIVRAALRRRNANDEDIDDVTQRVLISCWRGRSTAEHPGEAVAFVRTTASNAFLDLVKKRRREESLEGHVELPAEAAISPVDLRDLRRLEQRVLAALVEADQGARLARVAAFLRHRLDPNPPPDDPGPPHSAEERVRVRDQRQQARSVGRKYILQLLGDHGGWFDDGELELLAKIAGEMPPCAPSDDPPEQRHGGEE